MGKNNDQLCWSCKKACGGDRGCAWFNGFIPIPGWTAYPTISDIIRVRKVKSFRIKKCPLYEKEECNNPRRKNKW